MTHIDVSYYPQLSAGRGCAQITVVPVTFWGECFTKYTIHLSQMTVYWFLDEEWRLR